MRKGADRVPTPRSLAALAHRRLAAAASAKVAEASRAYFKGDERVSFYGVKAPLVRAVESELFALVKGRWAPADAIGFCDLMLAAPQLEAKGLGTLLLFRFSRDSGPGLLHRCRTWLGRGLAANWATTDALSTLVIAPLLRRRAEEIATVVRWTEHRSLWVRRAAAVSLTPLARRGLALDASYRVATALLDDANDLIHKATGWLLRECGATDRRRLEAFLREQGPRLPRTALRYAIEHFPADDRRRLLLATRASFEREPRRARRSLAR